LIPWLAVFSPMRAV
jgi:hypothetical protein